MDDDRFRNAIHQLCAALHLEYCDPGTVTMELPREQWWRLSCSLERKYGGVMGFTGRGPEPSSFRYMGISFKATP